MPKLKNQPIVIQLTAAFLFVAIIPLLVFPELQLQKMTVDGEAAVEAARAGEHGRGFAVVATEVRALPEPSKPLRRVRPTAAASKQGSTAGQEALGADDSKSLSVRER